MSVRDDEIIVGGQAKSRLSIDPKNSIASTKREIGSSQEVKVTIQEELSGINKTEVLKLV